MLNNGLPFSDAAPSPPAPPPGTRENPWSVGDLSREVRALLEGVFPALWVEGEIGSLRRPASGHLYFNLKDSTSLVRVVIFRSAAGHLGFPLEDGQKVLVRGRVSAYPGRSEYQLVGQQVQLCGRGDLLLAFERLKRKLDAQGLFDARRKRPVPRFIDRLGVITSPSGAALRDVRSVLARRCPGTRLTVYPVPVQGREAPAALVTGLAEMNRLGRFDALLLTRGGGSLEDLWAFNDEQLALAVAASRLPVISAIGHRTDLTICDLVADLHAPTPSAAAEMLSLHRVEMLDRLRQQRRRLVGGMEARLRFARQALEHLGRRPGFRGPQETLQLRFQRLDELVERLGRAWPRELSRRRLAWEALARRLDGLSPLAVLARGYSITSLEDGSLARDAALLAPGRLVRTRLARGAFTSRVVAPLPDGPPRGGRRRRPPAADGQGRLF